jgi:SAM-dependent methyltransferase
MASPAGDFDYEQGGSGYGRRRRTDPRIAAVVHAALGPARTVINVGAGAGSYEPEDREVTAVEPSAVMRAQRGTPAIDAVAEDLPFADDTFDAGMAMVTVHQWPELAAGLAELRRVVRGPVLVLSFDGDQFDKFWAFDYLPELRIAEAGRMPAIGRIRQLLGGTSIVTEVPIPIDCVDGFLEAFYARPEQLLRADVRQAQSAWAFVAPEVVERGLQELAADLASGEWDRKYGGWRARREYRGSLVLITAQP